VAVIITVVFFNNLGKLLALRIWIRPLQAVSISNVCQSLVENFYQQMKILLRMKLQTL
jgi:hypothetical protein